MTEFFEGLRTDLMRKRRAKWVQMTRERMRECENEFGKSGIYEKDWRYFNVRCKLIMIQEKLFLGN